MLDDSVRSEVIGTAGLTLAACIAVLLTWIRPLTAGRVDERRRTTLLFSVGLLVQVLHVAEEYSTRFYARFPPILGLAPWSSDFFLIFNLCWLAIWVWAAVGLRAGYKPAIFPAWFFAIAATVNGVAHPVLAARVAGYFPGLLTSPLLGGIGVWLCVRLVAITEFRPGRLTGRNVLLFIEALIFSVVVPGAVVYWIPRDALGLWGELLPQPRSVWQTMGTVPLALGLTIYLRCLWEFARRGRGIPAPVDHPKTLVVTGLYRYVRNPMYLGVLLFLLGESLFFESLHFLLYAITWLAFVHVNVILYEEPNLRRKFGSSYNRYQSAVRRWIPGKAYLDAG